MSGTGFCPSPQRTSCDPARAKALLAVDGDDSPFAWAALSGHPPKPEGSRLLARGVDGDSARQATILIATEVPFAQARGPANSAEGIEYAPVSARQPMEVIAVGVSALVKADNIVNRSPPRSPSVFSAYWSSLWRRRDRPSLGSNPRAVSMIWYTL
jgi:hypothetical protein